MRRSLTVAALVAAVITLVASVAVAIGVLGVSSSWPTSGQGQRGSMMYGQGLGAGMMGGPGGGSMMGSMGMVWLSGDGVAVSGIPARIAEQTVLKNR